MDETSLDEGPGINFERATLEIAKDVEVPDGNQPSESSTPAPRQTTARNLPSIPFKRIDAQSFFSDRNEVVDRALKDCCTDLIKDYDSDVVGSWLLTEISLWDTEKERLVLLTKNALYSVKYDFISLKILEYNRVLLSVIDTLISGQLVYPPKSLIPRLNGIAEGVSNVVQCGVRQQWSSMATGAGLERFEPRDRNATGLRLMWNRGEPLSLDKKWNPFARNIPWLTYTSHPLFWHKGNDTEKSRFDVEDLHANIVNLLPEECQVLTGSSIILENYLGLGALFHNRNSLGFFKIRGKVSF
ncbi:tumor protein p63-regulated gene 1-like protein isoform X1 [Cephus cinctus]|uniref:Tumor protein p63-regulated gene 1-like protein isoform X1 n=1 Tax=Cephus cinctus TaxID=211228 RepID=A0AAJ7FM54_CEPCN|nr:tumor protein p63-regulated gene 1-like protein isoform X1 [Cephus cinctus]